jgi:hypothetical protein
VARLTNAGLFGSRLETMFDKIVALLRPMDKLHHAGSASFGRVGAGEDVLRQIEFAVKDPNSCLLRFGQPVD